MEDSNSNKNIWNLVVDPNFKIMKQPYLQYNN